MTIIVKSAALRSPGSAARVDLVLVVNRFRVPTAEAEAFRVQATRAHQLLAACPGYVDGTAGRNVDHPSLWVLQTRWENVGSYRRALSSYDVKVHAVAVLATAIEEPSAYEVVNPSEVLNLDVPRAMG